MARALLVVPPLLKYAAGPLLGPALLEGVARDRGHDVAVLDLNIRFLVAHLAERETRGAVRIHGDHARPPGGLRGPVDTFLGMAGAALAQGSGRADRNAALTLAADHAEVQAAARTLAASAFGSWVCGQLDMHAGGAPDLVGVSVLYSGQVLAGLATTMVARDRWPGVPIVWGGPHVTALRDVIPSDPEFGRWVDGFVFGAAERTFVELLDAVHMRGRWPAEVIGAGSTGNGRAKTDPGGVPRFGDLQPYGFPVLTLPAQTGRGCVFGQCAYCTYPQIEGKPVDLGLAMLAHVVAQAERHEAVVSIKDSLLVAGRLRQVADCVDGRVGWAGCTKLHPRLDRVFVKRLGASGCRTLEFGLETLLGDSQVLIRKHQPAELFRQVMAACATGGVQPVVNLITGFPGEDQEVAREMVGWVTDELCRIGGHGFGHVEHNRFELERLAPLAKDPRIEVVGCWPWASVMDWRWKGDRP